METSIWFYTFSTSAQVMAALVGLFAVFVVYKIQDFSQLIEDSRAALTRILTYVSANTNGYQAIRMEDMVQMKDKEILLTFAELLISKQNGDTRVDSNESMGRINFGLNDTTYDYYARLVNKKSRILSRLMYILILSLSAIALSLIALVATNLLTATYWPLVISLVFFLFCLEEMGRGIYIITLE